MIRKISRKNGFTYCARIYVNGRQVSKTFKRRVDAELWERTRLHERDTGKIGFGRQEQRLQLKSFAAKWFAERVEPNLSPSTKANYRADLDLHILPLLGELRLNQILVSHGHTLVARLTGKGLAPKSVNGTMMVLKGMLNDAVRWELAERNPLASIRPLKLPPRNEVFWTASEISQFLEANRNDPLYPVYVFALNTGLRKGEICALKWDRINFSSAQVEITRTIGKWGLRETTKNGKRRVIPMNEQIRGLLFEQRKCQRSEFVFANNDGTPIDANHLYRDFHAAQRRAGFTYRIRVHDLRHCFASHFMMNGGNIYDLQKLLGHGSLDVTQRYAHLSPSHLAKAAEVVSFGAYKQQIGNKAKVENVNK